MPNIFKKIFKPLYRHVGRPGLQFFIDRNLSVAVGVIEELSKVHDPSDFHSWKPIARAHLRGITREMKDNWIELLLGIAFEQIKRR